MIVKVIIAEGRRIKKMRGISGRKGIEQNLINYLAKAKTLQKILYMGKNFANTAQIGSYAKPKEHTLVHDSSQFGKNKKFRLVGFSPGGALLPL